MLFLILAASLPCAWARSLSVGGENWEKTSEDFFRYVKVEDEVRFTSFAANKANDMGIALFRFVPGPSAEALEFTVYGGNGKIFLIEDHGTLALDGTTDIVEAGRMLAASEYGRVLETASGPRDTSDGNRVRWNLVPRRGKPLIIAVVDDLTGPWGFIGLSPINIVAPGSAATDDRPATVAGESVVFDGQEPRILMPGGSEWGYVGGPFFSRNLFRGRTPFISTNTNDRKQTKTGATWLGIALDSGGEFRFQVRGGDSHIYLLRGRPDFSGFSDAAAIQREIEGALSRDLLESTNGGGAPRKFVEVTWKLSPDLREATILVLDSEGDDNGYIDVTSITLHPTAS